MPRQPPDQFRVQFLRKAIQVFLSKLEVGLALHAGRVTPASAPGNVSRRKNRANVAAPVLEGYFRPLNQLLGLFGLGVFRGWLPAEYIPEQIVGYIVNGCSPP